MQKITWHKHLETGNELIDLEHKELFQFIESCLDMCGIDADRRKVLARLDELYKLLADHFDTEKSIMASKGLHLFSSHLKQHNHLLELFQLKFLEFNNLNNKLFQVEDFLVHVQDWCVTHINTEDKLLVGYMNSN